MAKPSRRQLATSNAKQARGQRAASAAGRVRGRDPGLSVRDRIYTAALQCFERDGVRDSNMQTIGDRAGVSRQTVYYYFPNKNALIIEVIARQVRMLREELREHVQPGGIDALLEAFCETVILLGGNTYCRLLMRPDTVELTAQLAETDILRGLSQEWWNPYLAMADARHELRTDVDYDDIIHWLVLTTMAFLNAEHTQLADESQVAALAATFLRPSLVAPTATSTKPSRASR